MKLQTNQEADHDTVKAVLMERERQIKLYGIQNHTPEFWLTILVEEVGEIAKAICEGNKYDLRREAIQVAAVAVAIAGALENDF